MTRRMSAILLAAALSALLAGCAPGGRDGRGPEDEPVVWPLLGSPAPAASAVDSRVVCVKVENDRAARPQSGLAEADVVYETIIEGGSTRFNALYHSRAPKKVGPVRSGRVSDTYIVPQYRALLARIGGNYVTEDAFDRTENLDDMNAFDHPAPYSRSRERRAPHNLYVSIPELRRSAATVYAPTASVTGLEFGSAPASATGDATSVDLNVTGNARVRWTWSVSRERYERSFNGSREGDAGTDEPYHAANVVVLLAEMVPTKALDPAGNPTYDVRLEGSGEAVVFRDGKRFDGMWTAGSDAPPLLTEPDGDPIPLAAGVTWFEVLRTGTPVGTP